ncbi:MAG: type II secretion system F family protein [Candidatus Nealsonbacteria bacterium]
MPKFLFSAKSKDGQPYSDTRQAKDERDLARILQQEGYVLISAVAQEEADGNKSGLLKSLNDAFASLFRVSLKEKTMFTRNLQVMVGAGVSLPKSLRTLSLQVKNKNFSQTLIKIADEVMQGKTFSESLSHYPQTFSDLFCNMIRAGEESGTLEENLGVLSRQMERDYEMKSKIMGALLYPAVILTVMFGIGIMMLIVVVPRLADTFEDMNAELPLTTKIIVGLGTFLAEKWYFVILILIVSIFIFWYLLKLKSVKRLFDAAFLKMPIISPIVKQSNAAYTVRTLSSLISAGVSLIRSLEIISGTMSNSYFKQAIVQSIEKVKKGEKLSSALQPYKKIYPISVIQMIEVGEETGETSKVLQRLGLFFEEEVERATKNLISVIEPILMLLIGGVVGFFAVSMIQPMYSVLSEIK